MHFPQPERNNLFFEANLEHLLRANTPVNSFKVINCVLCDCDIFLNTLGGQDEPDYGHTDVLMLGNTYLSNTDRAIIGCTGNRTASIKVIGSTVQGDFKPKYTGNIELLESDIDLIRE